MELTGCLLDVQRASGPESVYGRFSRRLLDPNRDQHARGSLSHCRLGFGWLSGLFVHIRCFIGATDRTDQRAGISADAGAYGDAHGTNDGCGCDPGSGAYRRANTASLGGAHAGLSSAWRAFIVAATGIDIMLTVGVEVEGGQRVSGETCLS